MDTKPLRRLFKNPSFKHRLGSPDKKIFQINPFQIMLATLSINILSLALPLTSLQVYDRIILRGGTDTLYVLAVSVLVAATLESALRLSRAYVTGWAGAAHEHTLACKAVRHILKAAPTAFRDTGIGAQMGQMAAIGKLREFYSGQALITLIDLPFVFLFLGIIGYIGGVLVLVPLALLAIFSLRAWMTGRDLKHGLKARDEADDARYDFLIETLNGIHTVKSQGAEAAFSRRYEARQHASSAANLDVAYAGANAYNDGIIFSQVMNVACVLAGAPLAAYGHMTMGALIACVLLAGRIMQPVQRCMSLWARFQDMKLAEEKLSKLFAVPELYTDASTEKTNEGRIELKNLYFRYRQEAPLLIKDCNLTLKRGDTIAIAGQAGTGRSTLLQLMAGILPPSDGDVLINGVSAYVMPSEALAAQVAYMPTQAVIFRGTIRENITRFGLVPEHQADEISRLLGIEDEVAKLPRGYDTLLDNTTADPISPGLKQRIAIARVLAVKPRIILFDKADRALDKEGYNQVYRLLGRLKGKVTMALVSDDRNVLSLADKICTVDGNGVLKIVDTLDEADQVDAKVFRELRA